MDSSNAEQLTDAEAEAALLALSGPPLVWQHRGIDNCLSEAASVNAPGQSYSIRFDPGRNGFQALWWRFGSVRINPTLFKTRAAARIACERHHATEEWE